MSCSSRIKVVHAIPYDGIGGVETAARSLVDGVYDDIDFSKLYLVDKSDHPDTNTYTSENHPLAYWAALRTLCARNPDVLVASLWRSCAVLIAFKLLRPRTPVVTFLHLPVDVHWLDWALNRLAMLLSREIWCDSQTTLVTRVPKVLRRRTRVISFLVHRLSAPVERPVGPSFIFWGRLHPQKGLIRALRLFARVRETQSGAAFHIVGPDGGERAALDEEVTRLGLQPCVHFHGAMAQPDIFSLARGFAFYLQTSVSEGMALSVVEAMQLGLVPVVTAVGEIGRYCVHEKNALIVDRDEDAVKLIIEMLSDGQRYQAMSRRAVATLADQPLYAESVLSACRGIFEPKMAQDH